MKTLITTIAMLAAGIVHAEFEDNKGIQAELARQQGYKCVWCLAQGTQDTALLDLLSTSKDKKVREVVALNDNTTEITRLRLAKDVNEDVRWDLAGRPGLSNSVQHLLAHDASLEVVKEIAQHIEPVEDIRYLMATYANNSDVLYDLTLDLYIPTSLMKELTTTPFSMVNDEAKIRLLIKRDAR